MFFETAKKSRFFIRKDTKKAHILNEVRPFSLLSETSITSSG